VRYQRGLFLPVPGVGSLEKAAQDQEDDELFLTLLDQFDQQGRIARSATDAHRRIMRPRCSAKTKGRGAHQRLGSPPPWRASSPPRRYASQLTAAHRGPTPSSFEGPANEPAYKFPAYRCHPRVGSPYPYRGCTTGTGARRTSSTGVAR
jgi:hypothetical protein